MIRVKSYAPEWNDPYECAWRVQIQDEDDVWHDTDIHGESNWALINLLVVTYHRYKGLEE